MNTRETRQEEIREFLRLRAMDDILDVLIAMNKAGEKRAAHDANYESSKHFKKIIPLLEKARNLFK